jgi:hypothetical protein
VLNLKSLFSSVKTKEAGLEAAIGETILHIPEILRSNISIQTEKKRKKNLKMQNLLQTSLSYIRLYRSDKS